MSISSNVVIMTKEELEAFKHKWFQKGVERGRFEERYERNNPGAKATKDITGARAKGPAGRGCE